MNAPMANRPGILPVTLLIVALLAAKSPAQHALPMDMVADFEGGRMFAEQLFLPMASPDDSVRACVRYENEQAPYKLIIEWSFAKNGAALRTTTQEYELSFRPTAVARVAGESNTFYVVGWIERTGQVIVQSIVFGQYALGSTITPSGQLVSTFGQPVITGEIVWIADASLGIHPVWDAGYDCHSGILYMLESGSPTRLLSLTLPSGTLGVMCDASAAGFEALEGHRMVSVGLHASMGFAIYTQPRRVFDRPTAFQPPYYRMVLRDAAGDGVFESTTFYDHDDFVAAYPSSWDPHYTCP